MCRTMLCSSVLAKCTSYVASSFCTGDDEGLFFYFPRVHDQATGESIASCDGVAMLFQPSTPTDLMSTNSRGEHSWGLYMIYPHPPPPLLLASYFTYPSTLGIPRNCFLRA